jgi:hypothetical protein
MPGLIQEILAFAADSGEIWYRGHKFHDYFLEPSAYRYSPFQLNSKQIEEESILAARSAMIHISETHILEDDLNWLCYLQHNRLPTRLLDWTFEFQVALYFAFEDYLQNKADAGSLPCLWAFRPKNFLQGISDLINDKSELRPLGIDPEKSAEVTKEILAARQPKDASFISKLDNKDRDLWKDMYIPFFSPYVNERAKLQGGCFIRFPLLNERRLEKWFIEHRLELFVQKYSKYFSNCLVKFVFIHPSKMKDDLSMLNLKTSRIYPEVENIALSIKQRFFET